ncbi:hypothetical protein E3N88_14084 [Mikania micrantha]|uniref:Uncharacterized protein n=1 Tax=Mikania micrantha TaxID=192012 RepID=A0A5N6P0H1_9ASTR|nr:hypothetical protein E3N88_14084 [Mikania micrantha]
MGDHSDGDHQQVATRSKKKHRPHYIAQLSMNKFANIAKQHRVIGPKVSQKFPLDSNATKENQSRVSMTMAELISRNKRSPKQKEVFKGGAKRRLVLLDKMMKNDNGVEMELDGLKCDESEGEYFKFQEIQMDDSEDDLENEDDVQIQEQLQDSELKNKTAISESKKRGPTMLHLVHTRKVDDREVIICNEFGQPVGPVTKEKDVVGRFSRFLGTIARNHSYAPLIYNSWHKVPHKYKIWEYVLEKYDVPDAARKWFLMTIGHSYKEQMKKYKSSENESDLIDPFMAVMHKENSGYCRLYGRGVTNKLIKKKRWW